MVRLTLIAAAGFAAAVALTGPATGDLLPTLPTLPTIPVTLPTTPPPAPPVPPVVPPPPPLPPVPPVPEVPPQAPPAGSVSAPTSASATTPAGAPARGTPAARANGSKQHAGAAVIRVRLRAGGTVLFVVHSGCAMVGSRRVRARKGVNRVGFAPRRLSPGTYRVNVELLRAGKRRHLRTVGVTVAREHGRLTSRLRLAPAAPACAAMLPPTVLAAGSPLIASRTPAPTGGGGGGGPARGGVLGATFALPGFGSAVTDGHNGGLAGFVLAMYAIAGLAIATLLVHGGRVLLLRARKP